jgi:four helix bundle protein
MDKIRSFHDLIVWQRSIELVEKIYELTKQFPPEEKYGPTSQIQRAAVSIPSNIAQGQARNTKAAFANYGDIALDSAAELETQLTIAHRIGYLPKTDFDTIIPELTEITRMLYGLLRRLRPKN